MRLRPWRPGDLEALVALNAAAAPAVNVLDAPALLTLLEWAEPGLVAVDAADVPLGLMLCLRAGHPYASPNYRWFSQRHAAFAYVDRVVVAESARGHGIGTALYLAVAAEARGLPLVCEVNVRPVNEGSLRFHQRLGFVEVGRQDTEGGTKTVALLERVDPMPPR